MASNIALILSTSQQGVILGDSSVTSLERTNTIEVVKFTSSVRIAFDRATLQATGRRFYEPLTFTKFVDRSTPLLRRALINNEIVVADFRWYRTNPNGNGTEERYLRVQLAGARIVSATLRLSDTLDPDTVHLPHLEDIGLAFNTITWTYESGNVTFVDNWDASR